MSYRLWLQTISWPRRGGGSVAANVAAACEILRAAPRNRPLLICFPEAFFDWKVKAPVEEIAAAIDESWPMLREAASGIDGLALLPAVRRGEQDWQIATLCLDGRGVFAATYVKRHPWPRTPDLATFEYDAVPGADSPVISVGSCRIGIQMCFDVNWADGWRRLAEGGARLILFPSAYPGGFALRVRAWESGAVVAAAVLGGGPSPVIDVTGEVLALRHVRDNGTALCLNLNRACVHRDHQAEKLARLEREAAGVSVTRLPMDNVALVVGPAEGPSVETLLDRFGIETRAHYLARARVALDARADRDGGDR